MLRFFCILFSCLFGALGYYIYRWYSGWDIEYKKLPKRFFFLGMILGGGLGCFVPTRGELTKDIFSLFLISLCFMFLYLFSLMDEVCGKFSVLPLFIALVLFAVLDATFLIVAGGEAREIFGMVVFIMGLFILSCFSFSRGDYGIYLLAILSLLPIGDVAGRCFIMVFASFFVFVLRGLVAMAFTRRKLKKRRPFTACILIGYLLCLLPIEMWRGLFF